MTRLGTPSHIAPEVYAVDYAKQVHKNVAIFDEKADVWSIGVMVYSISTGKLPF